MGEPCKEGEDLFEWEVRDESIPFAHHAVAGSLAGVSEHIGMFPLDTIKTRMQASPGLRVGAGEALQSILRERGVGGLMRGSTVIGVGVVPAHIGLFGTYEWSMAKLVDRQQQEHQPVRTAACGALSATVHDAVLTPHDVVKQRLQLGRHHGALDCVASMLRTEGFGALYRSLPATLAMNVPFVGILTATNESLKLLLKMRHDDVDAKLSNASWYFMCAGLSGAVAAAVTSPLDVVKTKLQTQGAVALEAAPSGMRQQPQYHGILSTSRSILQQGGLHGAFRGCWPRILMAAPASAMSWGTYETVRMFLKDFKWEDSRLREMTGRASFSGTNMLTPVCHARERRESS
jgi:solute carrier family 25 iron transporter 28/37